MSHETHKPKGFAATGPAPKPSSVLRPLDHLVHKATKRDATVLGFFWDDRGQVWARVAVAGELTPRLYEAGSLFTSFVGVAHQGEAK